MTSTGGFKKRLHRSSSGSLGSFCVSSRGSIVARSEFTFQHIQFARFRSVFMSEVRESACISPHATIQCHHSDCEEGSIPIPTWIAVVTQDEPSGQMLPGELWSCSKGWGLPCGAILSFRELGALRPKIHSMTPRNAPEFVVERAREFASTTNF